MKATEYGMKMTITDPQEAREFCELVIPFREDIMKYVKAMLSDEPPPNLPRLFGWWNVDDDE